MGAAAGDGRRHGRPAGQAVTFWTHQAVHLVTALVLGLGVLSIWFGDPAHLATFVGLVSAGLAFALQRVVTAVAGYVVILRGNTFNVGDRITTGGVRGDVIALGFFQTTIVEMGQPPAAHADEPGAWVGARQYTGRIVTVTNDKVFDTPVFNYTRDFPYIWEEVTVPVRYADDRRRPEAILLAAAEALTVPVADAAEAALAGMERRHAMRRADLRPRVSLRLTSNWVELTVRFVTKDHAVTVRPATVASDAGDAEPLSFAFDLPAAADRADVRLDLRPTMRVDPAGHLRLSVAVDGGAAAVYPVPGGESGDENTGPRREGAITNRVQVKLPPTALAAGRHTLRVTAVDPGVVLDHIELPAGAISAR